MDLILWLIFGALAGWIASMFMGTNAKQGLVANVVVGVVGAFIGGYVFRFFGGSDVSGFNFYSLVVAVVGAVIFLAVLRKL